MVEFNQPTGGGGFFATKNAVGHLVLITKVHDVYHNAANVYQGKLQPRDEAKVDIVDLDGDGLLGEGMILTHPGLVNKLRAGASNVLGRITEEPTKDGSNTYYNLSPYQDDDPLQAQMWIEKQNSLQVSQPQSHSQGPAATQGTHVPQSAPNVPQSGQQAAPAAAPALPAGVDQQQLLALLAQMQAGGQQLPNGNPPY